MLLGGAAAVVYAVGFSGDGDDKLPSNTTTTTATSFDVMPAPTPTARPDPVNGGNPASLRGCIIGLNCGPISPKHSKRAHPPGRSPAQSHNVLAVVLRWSR
jgi:hypothetical protein